MKTAVRGAALLAIAACSEEHFARVTRIESMAQAVGGPAAAAAVGDFLIENDRIRLAVHARPDDTGTSVAFGGTIVDADLQRPEETYRYGRGLDQLMEFGPFFNVKVPDARNLPEEEAFQVLREESSDPSEGVTLRVETPAGDMIDAISLLGVLIPPFNTPNMWFRTDYELRPGEPFVRLTTIAYPDGISDRKPEPMPPLIGERNLLEVLAGDVAPTCTDDEECPEGETCENVIGSFKACRTKEDPSFGAFGAVLPLFGGKLDTFMVGPGFDPWLNLKAALAQDVDVFENPTAFPYLAAIGDKISYAIFSDGGDIVLPMASSDFTIAVTNEFHCPSSEPTCVRDRALQMRAFLAIGKGDIASAVEPFYELRNIPTGRIRGVVVYEGTGEPISDVDVIAFEDPWPEDSDEEVASQTYAAVVSANRGQSRSLGRPVGQPGIVSHFRSDVGTDRVLDGDFSGLLPVESGEKRYLLFAAKGEIFSHRPVVTRVIEGGTTEVVVALPRFGRLEFDVRDENGVSIPSKLTIGQCLSECGMDANCADGQACVASRCVPKNGCQTDAQCAPDEFCDSSGDCVCRGDGVLPREIRGNWFSDGIMKTAYSRGGLEAIELAPGTYEAIFSRGIEYSIDRRYVTVESMRTLRIEPQISRVVDTSGFVGSDFHVHGWNSPDSGIPHEARVRTYVAEGVEFLSSSDHDVFTDYGPTILQEGLATHLATQVGVEVSPFMLSHFLGFPMQYDETRPQNMPEPIAFDWYRMSAGRIMDSIRAGGSLGGGGDAIVVIPHIWDYYNYYGLDPFTLALNPSALLQLVDSLFLPENFSGHFDGLEIFNARAQDYIRRPTVAEMFDYRAELAALSEAFTRDEISIDEFTRLHVELGKRIVAKNLTRTPEEQTAFLEADSGAACRCGADSMCGDGVCDPGTGDCTAGCSSEKDCAGTFQPVCDIEAGRCIRPCESETDCLAFANTRCDATLGRCVPIASGDNVPCSSIRGIVDDWFRMLNHGVYRVAQANSDSHGTHGNEAGMPRTFVRSSTDLPAQIDPDEINRSVRDGAMLSTYGPFVRFEVNGMGMGETVESGPGKPVHLYVSVQSPLWFDVDRVELYRNGEVFRVFEGCDVKPNADVCIVVPNDSVLNLEVNVSDEPDRDAWYAVVAMGVRGRNLAPVYGSPSQFRFGFIETIGGLFEFLPIGAEGLAPVISPAAHPVLPYAITNPIWVDVDGGGFTPLAPAPDWARK